MARMTLCLACVLVLAVATAASAQVTFGGKVGLNLANVSYTEEIPPSVTLGNRDALVAGGFVDIAATRHIAIQPELLFSMNGAVASVNESRLTARSTLEVTSLDVPVLVRFDLRAGGAAIPYAFAGPNVRFNLSAKATSVVEGAPANSGGVSEHDMTSDVKTTEFAVALGGGVRFGRFLAELRYTRGFTNIFKSTTTANGVTTSHALAVIGGVRF